MKILLAANADPELVNEGGQTPQDIAMSIGANNITVLFSIGLVTKSARNNR